MSLFEAIKNFAEYTCLIALLYYKQLLDCLALNLMPQKFLLSNLRLCLFL